MKKTILIWLLVLPTLCLARVAPLVSLPDRPYPIPSGLDSTHLVVYGSHGYYYDENEDRWKWQRARLFTTVEDVYTTAYVQPFLVPMLENAGAVVLQPRERDFQTREYILPSDSAVRGKDWVRVWDDRQKSTHLYHPATKKRPDTLRYMPHLTEEGDFCVYVRSCKHPGSTTKAHYIVRHAGQESHVLVNQQMSSDVWVYIGKWHFDTRSEKNAILLTTEGRDKEVITSSGVRLGGGMGSIKRGTSTSGAPRWAEAARYYLEYCGYPQSIWDDPGYTDYKDDLYGRGHWINYLCGGSRCNPQAEGLEIPIDAVLALHSDAGITSNDSIIGTLAIYSTRNGDNRRIFPDGSSRNRNGQLALAVHQQVIKDIRATWAPEWTEREVVDKRYVEARYTNVPTLLLELLSHQNYADMRYGLDPRFRFTVSRSIYKGMLRFLRGEDAVVQPLPVQAVCAELEQNTVRLTWTPQADTLEPSALPDGYVIYRRIGEDDWDNGRYCRDTCWQDTLCTGLRHDYRIVAVNAGGASFPSAVVSAGYPTERSKGTILIIDGYNRLSAPDHFQKEDSIFAGFRPDSYGVAYGPDYCYIGSQYVFDRTRPWTSDDDPGHGASFPDWAFRPLPGNTFDHIVLHADALLKAGYSFSSCTAQAADTLLLTRSDYTVVDLILGKQHTTLQGTIRKDTSYSCFPAHLRSLLTKATCPLLVSGAYIGSDMQSPDDRTFTRTILHYEYLTSRATHTGTLSASPTTIRTLPTDSTSPFSEANDGIKPTPDGRIIARYGDTGIAAAVAAETPVRTLVFAFPLEATTDFETRYIQSINWLTSHE